MPASVAFESQKLDIQSLGRRIQLEMKYYVVADVHGFFDELKFALTEKGFFTDTEQHKLIVCGDLFDRGKQAAELQEFIIDLLAKDEVILIRGNHEDLMLELLKDWFHHSYWRSHHRNNGTVDTVLQLTQMTIGDLAATPYSVEEKLQKSPLIQTIIPSMLDYYETSHYIFVHGWISCTVKDGLFDPIEYIYNSNWRDADKVVWNKARWQNGMQAAHNHVVEPGKKIVCGHWHCSFGHAHYEKKGGEFENDPDFSPYYGEGIIALDACTAFSKKVNCIVIDDEADFNVTTENER